MNNQPFISVVVADDEHLIAKSIAKNIERCNPLFHVVSVVHNGEDALEVIQKELPQILFTDINMPVMDGLTLIENARKLLPELHCVVISGYNDFEYAQKAIRFGVTDYLLKPIVAEELTKLLKDFEISFITNQEDFDSRSNHFSTEELVNLAIEYIHKHYASQLDLNTLAERLGFSSSYLTKIFAKHMGVTPSKYIRHYRMTIACQLLQNPELAVVDVATSVGYTDPFHFSKSFKAEIGVSPSNYRNNCFH